MADTSGIDPEMVLSHKFAEVALVLVSLSQFLKIGWVSLLIEFFFFFLIFRIISVCMWNGTKQTTHSYTERWSF